jgi:GNAT superfamily N-acetyltransferase
MQLWRGGKVREYHDYTIRLARGEELPLLQEIEQAAGQRFRTVGLPDVAEGAPLPLEVLRLHEQAGHVWVVADANERPAGFAVVQIIDGAAHLHEMDVHPAHSGRGLGRRLIQHICAWASEQGFQTVTLSTFRAVPWNAPWYARMGFRCLGEDELTPGLHSLRQQEERTGLPIEQRVCMRYDLTTD